MTSLSAQYDSVARSDVPSLGPMPRRNFEMLDRTVLPALRALLRSGYFSLEVEGAEYVPRTGSAIYVGNHAGWFTLDTLMGALVISDFIGPERLPWGAVQDQLLSAPTVGSFFRAVGGFPASWLRTPERIPAAMEVFSIYPEGAEGNCKSFLSAYRMQPWRTGFVRMAIARRAAVVPVAIIGGEECLPSLSMVTALKPLFGTVLPVPLAILPLPSRWKFIFHKPIALDQDDLIGAQHDLDRTKRRMREIAEGVREVVQQTIDRETSSRMLVRLSSAIRNAWSPTHTNTGAPA